MTDHVDHVTHGKDFQYNSSVKKAKIISNVRSFLKDGVTYTKTKWILFTWRNAGNSVWQDINGIWKVDYK